MNRNAFFPADILVPTSDFMEWSVIACDQYSSEPEYWERVEKITAGKKSTLNMIIPEAYLEGIVVKKAAAERNAVMDSYLNEETFTTLTDSFIYIEREMADGTNRCGLVGKLDLDAYDYSEKSSSPVRASEKTIIERLPIRVAVREGASLELPHVMVLIDDADKTVVEPVRAMKGSLEKVYDFDLMENGGHIAGWRVTGSEAEKVLSALEILAEKPVQIVVGDGNHSLAAAKESWKNIKQSLTPEEIKVHPARFALVELNNVYDDGIQFEPIHRVVFNVDTGKFISELKSRFSSNSGYEIICAFGSKKCSVFVPNMSAGQLIAVVQDFLDTYVKENGADIDFIHDNEAVMSLVKRANTVGVFMPIMEKNQLFESVISGGVFPRKSFSIGQAKEKRYYLECRKIK